MGCDCQETGLGNTQKNLTAWVQPNGAGPLNSVYYAMADSGQWPGLKITGAKRNRRGTITPIHRRSGRDPRRFIRVGSRIGAPAANTITLELAEAGCGGFMPSELVQCLLDVYQFHNCCGQAGQFETGWSRIDIFTGLDIESDEFSDGVSYDSEADGDLFIRHAAEFREKLTIYPMIVQELGASAGLDTSTGVLDVVYADQEQCGNACGAELGCSDRWYSVTDEGTIIYKANRSAALDDTSIAGYPGSTLARVGMLGNRLFVSYFNTGTNEAGYYWSNLDGNGVPGTWTKVITDAAGASGNFAVRGFLKTNNVLWMFGGNELTGAKVYEIARDTTVTLLYSSTAVGTTIGAMASCGSAQIAITDAGVVLASSCNNVLAPTSAAPTATVLRTIGIRQPGEWWVGGDGGRVWYTTDSGLTWTQKMFSFSGTGTIENIVWANKNVGWLTKKLVGVAGSLIIWTTYNGGKDWIDTAVDNDRVRIPSGGDGASKLVTPCCGSDVEQSNAFLIAGGDAGVGRIWQGQIQQCQ